MACAALRASSAPAGPLRVPPGSPRAPPGIPHAPPWILRPSGIPHPATDQQPLNTGGPLSNGRPTLIHSTDQFFQARGVNPNRPAAKPLLCVFVTECAVPSGKDSGAKAPPLSSRWQLHCNDHASATMPVPPCSGV
jgi:hypothetical protein